MKASEAKELTIKANKGSRMPQILRQIQKRVEAGTFCEVDYICPADIEELRALGYKVEVHKEKNMPFDDGNNMCTVSWID